MARQLTGIVLCIWRAFGRVRFTVRWDTGETATITVPKRQIDATIRTGDRVGTIHPDPPYTAEDLLRWNEMVPTDGPVPPALAPGVEWDTPPSRQQYHRVGGPAER